MDQIVNNIWLARKLLCVLKIYNKKKMQLRGNKIALALSFQISTSIPQL